MGCHTWFYKKSNKFSNETQIKSYIINRSKETIDLLLRDFDNEPIDYQKEILDDVSYYQKHLEKLNDLDNLEEIFNLIAENYLIMDNGNVYEELTSEFHDLFRYSDYEHPSLYSKEETFEFIKNKKIHISVINYNRLLSFWEHYPDGLIEFG